MDSTAFHQGDVGKRGLAPPPSSLGCIRKFAEEEAAAGVRLISRETKQGQGEERRVMQRYLHCHLPLPLPLQTQPSGVGVASRVKKMWHLSLQQTRWSGSKSGPRPAINTIERAADVGNNKQWGRCRGQPLRRGSTLPRPCFAFLR